MRKLRRKFEPDWVRTNATTKDREAVWKLMASGCTIAGVEKELELRGMHLDRDTIRRVIDEAITEPAIPAEMVKTLEPIIQDWILSKRPNIKEAVLGIPPGQPRGQASGKQDADAQRLDKPVVDKQANTPQQSIGTTKERPPSRPEGTAPPWAQADKTLARLAEGLAEGVERGQALLGQLLASQLERPLSSALKSFSCHKLGLKALSDMLSVLPTEVITARKAGELLIGIEQQLGQRERIQQQIEREAREALAMLGPFGLTQNFSLAAYHFYVRGDDSWLCDERFQVISFAPGGGSVKWQRCPQGDYTLRVEAWDTRSFICPEHGASLMLQDTPSWSPLAKPPESQTGLYIEDVVAIEDIVWEQPEGAGLSMRIPQMLPFSELVIAVCEVSTMPKLTSLVQDFLLAPSARRDGARRNEADLQGSYEKLMTMLRP